MWKWLILIAIFGLVASLISERFLGLRSLLSAVPHFAILIKGLYKDDRVPKRFKVALGSLVAYLASPVDLIPDFIPVLGYLDDVILIAIAFDAVVNQIVPDVVKDHWKGDHEFLVRVGVTAGRIASIVPNFIRRRVFGPASSTE